MYAIIEDSGTQFKVSEGDIVRVDLRPGDEAPESINFDRVLMIGGREGVEPTLGSPLVDGAKVEAEVLTEVRGDKITIFKFRRRKGYRRKKGHRQRFLRVRVTRIAC